MRKAFISPSKFIQGEDELLNLGYFIKIYGEKAILIANDEDVERVKEKLDKTAEAFGVSFVRTNFIGEASREEITRLKKLAKEEGCDCTIGLGGGKAIDVAKCVAEGERLIIAPTIAATDAPTSHSAVLYTADGVFDDYAYFKSSPDVVLVDTTVIANAPVRFLVSGIGDALSTYFEMRATRESYSNVNAGLPCGAREGLAPPAKGTLAAKALAEMCYRVILEDAVKAKTACEEKQITTALENIVEASILLSGLGFESGGLAGAHAIHDGLTILEDTKGHYHGEVVAFGTLAQLVLENADTDEIEKVLAFCVSLGLPVCLSDIGVKNISDEQLKKVAAKTCISEESIHSMPFPVSENMVIASIVTADRLGREYKKIKGVK